MTGLPRSAIAALRFCAALLLFVSVASSAQVVYPYPDAFPRFSTMKSFADATWVQRDGKVVVAGTNTPDTWGPSRAFAVIRANPDGTADPGFGGGGLVELPVWGTGDLAKVVLGQPDGKLLIGGHSVDAAGIPSCDYWAFCNRYIALFRLNADGSRDLSFNGTGRLVLHVGIPVPGAEEAGYQALRRLELAADGTILVYGGDFVGPTAPPPAVVARVRADGTVDPTFAGMGLTATEMDYTVAVELRNEVLDQYFVTADRGEIVALDRDPVTGWRWVGGGFHVYPAGADVPGTVPVCRFYGRPDAGLDSHVLTANEAECAALEADGGARWLLESRATFRVVLPDAATGACPSGHPPVYRLWNGRADGGHHLTIDRRHRDALVAKGYVAEGWGPLGVAMCAAP